MSDSHASAPGRPQAPPDLSDFELIRRLGAGANGEVWEAMQRSLSRRVAIKFVRLDTLGSDERSEALRREGRWLAALDHPDVISMLGFGEENGASFLVLEYVDGCDLRELRRQLLDARTGRRRPPRHGELRRALRTARDPMQQEERADAFRGGWFEVCARLVERVALVVEHAHRLGILHRDLSLSNVLIGTDGRLRIADFGSAVTEAEEPGSCAGSATRASSMGTLRALAPERLEGRHGGRRSEVYSLGMLLRELLAVPNDLDGLGHDAEVSAILTGVTVPERSFGVRIPWQLRAVIAAAIAPDPERRYESADEFARDLRRFLRNEPVSVDREPLSSRLRRWRRRRPALSAAVAATTALAVVGPTALALQDLRQARRLESAGRVAASHLHLAVQTVDEMLIDVGRRDLYGHPLFDGARAAMLASAVDALERIRARDGRVTLAVVETALRTDRLRPIDATVDDALLDARVALAGVQRDLGRFEPAEAQLALAAGLSPSDPVTRAQVEFELAAVQAANGARSDALASASRAARSVDHLVEGGGLAARIGMSAHLLCVELHLTDGRFELASASVENALRCAEAAASQLDSRVSRAANLDVARVLNSRAAIEFERGSFVDALETSREALERVSRAPRGLVTLETEGLALGNLGLALGATGREAEAEDSFEAALDIQSNLVAAFPDSPARRIALTRTRQMLASVRLGRDPADARAAELVAVALQDGRQLLDDAPGDVQRRVLVARLLAVSSWSRAGAGEFAAVEGELVEAADHVAACLDVCPEREFLIELEKRIWRSRATNAALRLRDVDLALGIVRSGLHAFDDDASVARDAAALLTICAALSAIEQEASATPPVRDYDRESLEQEALDALEEALDRGYDDAKDLDTAPPFAPLRGRARFEQLRGRLNR